MNIPQVEENSGEGSRTKALVCADPLPMSDAPVI
jgi:hypothetical protein